MLSAGVTAPHPNAACLLINSSGKVVSSACQRAQGTTPSEVLAVQQAREAAKGSTAYLNLETGDCHGDESAVSALLSAGVSRVVVGLRHPLGHLRYVSQLEAAAIGSSNMSSTHNKQSMVLCTSLTNSAGDLICFHNQQQLTTSSSWQSTA